MRRCSLTHLYRRSSSGYRRGETVYYYCSTRICRFGTSTFNWNPSRPIWPQKCFNFRLLHADYWRFRFLIPWFCQKFYRLLLSWNIIQIHLRCRWYYSTNMYILYSNKYFHWEPRKVFGVWRNGCWIWTLGRTYNW